MARSHTCKVAPAYHRHHYSAILGRPAVAEPAVMLPTAFDRMVDGMFDGMFHGMFAGAVAMLLTVGQNSVSGLVVMVC